MTTKTEVSITRFAGDAGACSQHGPTQWVCQQCLYEALMRAGISITLTPAAPVVVRKGR
jgi:hypothetical protein